MPRLTQSQRAARRRGLADLTREEIVAMTPRELERLLTSAGIEIDAASMREAADAVFATVAVASENGIDQLDDPTWAALDRRAENAMRDQIRRQVKGEVRDVRMEALRRGIDATGERAPKLIWIATMIGTCDSCVERHGREMSLAQWERFGLPGSVSLICDGNCNCQLLLANEEQDVEVDLEGLGIF